MSKGRWTKDLLTSQGRPGHRGVIAVVHQVVGEHGCEYDWRIIDYGRTNREIRLTDDQMIELITIVQEWWDEE